MSGEAAGDLFGGGAVVDLTIVGAEHDRQPIDGPVASECHRQAEEAVHRGAGDRIVEHGGPPRQALFDQGAIGPERALHDAGPAVFWPEAEIEVGARGGRCAVGVAIAVGEDCGHWAASAFSAETGRSVATMQ